MRTARKGSAPTLGSKAGRSLVIAAAMLLAIPALGHSPHHVIDDLELSPDYATDTTLFVLVHNYVLRSNNRASSWQPLVNGIDTPHVLTDIEISGRFGLDHTVFVASSGSGVFKSADRGNTWQRFNTGLRRNDIGMLLAITGAGEQHLLAAGSSRGLFMSAASAANWTRVLSDDVQITAMGAFIDGPDTEIFAGDSRGGLWRSGPGFQDWRRVAKLDGAGAITAITQDSRAGVAGPMLVGTAASGVLRLSVDGEVVDRLPQELPRASMNCKRDWNPGIRSIEFTGDGSRMLITTWSDGPYATDDGGRSWSVLDQGLRCNIQADNSAFSTPHFRDLALGGADSDWFIGSFEGLFRSVNQGETWVPVETMPISLVRGMGISGQTGDSHALLVTTYGSGAYLSADLGETWTIMNRGLVTTRLADAEFSPHARTRSQLFVLSRGRLSTAPGPAEVWTSESLADQSWPALVQRKLFGVPAKPVAWPMQIELSPAFADDRTMLLGFRRKGIWLSDDGGESWNRDWYGPTDYVTDMDISPNFANDGTVFAAIRGAGIYVTRDRATKWEATNQGFDFFADQSMTTSPNHFVDPPQFRAITDVVLAVSPAYAQDQTVFAGSPAGLFRSSDKGQTWHLVPVLANAENTSVVGLALSPDFENDGAVIVSVKGRGLYRSTDGGDSFLPIGLGLHAANAEPKYLEFSPNYGADGVIYAASDWSLWRSGDKGATWAKVQRPVRYEDWRGDYEGPVQFSGDWQRETNADFSASTQSSAEQKGAKAVLHFTGSKISWYGERGPRGGAARVTIDGEEVGAVNVSAPQVSTGDIVFSFGDLDDSLHEIVVEVLGGRVTIDNFDVSQ